MKKVVFVASFGDEQKEVELSDVSGTGGTWDLYVKKYWWGSFIKYQGNWEGRLHNPPGWLTKADLDILCDLIVAETKQIFGGVSG